MARKKKAEIQEEPQEVEEKNAPEDTIPIVPPPSYLIEQAKSSRTDCKKCGGKIELKSLRIGVIMEGEWGLFTRWQHVDCTVFHKQLESVEAIDGFRELSKEEQKHLRARFTASKNEIDEDFVPINPDEIVRKTWNETMEPPADLLMPLLPYQKEGLAWMYHQEQSSIHGGILADEMGMGKTIQGISAILSNPPDKSNKQQAALWKQSDEAHEWKGKLSERGNTLIIVPTVAIRQWQLEIARFTREGCLKVKVYHGADRSTTVDDLLAYDVILTSYKILEIEYRKATAGTKIECRICGKKFYPEKLRVHRKYFCGESAQRTEAQAKTQKKLTRIVKSAADSDSDDTIAKQKQKLKLKLVVKPKGKSQKKQHNVTLPSKSNESSSEDEIAKQKKQIKKALAEHNGKPSSRKRGNEKSKPSKSNESSSEDEVAKQKKQIKKALAEHNGKPSSRKRGNEKSKGKNANGKGKAKMLESEASSESEGEEIQPSKKRRANDKSAVSVRHKSQSKSKNALYFQSDSSEFEESSSEDGKKFVKSAKNSRKSKNSKKEKEKGKSGKALKGKKNAESEDSEFEEESESDSVKSDFNESDNYDVEKDIQEALLRHAKEMKKSTAPKAILHQISWFRIILDEAHLIKDRSTSTSRAVFNLTSLNKWCLTGTPLQNRVSELYSLIRFLRIDPYAYYFCKSKDCTCKSLHYRFTNSKCDDCNHSVISHYCQFNRVILNPIQRSGYIADGRKAMLKLKQQILDEILLRRTKTTRADDILLPTRIVRLRQEKMDEKEEDFYQALYTQSKAQFHTYLQSGTLLNNYAHIFDILIRLRQAVDHPYLVIYSESQTRNSQDIGNFTKNESSITNDTDWSKENCNLCQEPVECNQPVQATCGHIYCHSCIMDYIETVKSEASTPGSSNGGVKCPSCDQLLTLSLDPIKGNTADSLSNSVWNPNKRRKKSILDKIDLSLFQTSTKMEALMEELYKMENNDYGAKAIVFSQFVNMLDLLEYRIQKGGIGCTKLLGSMTLEQRDKAVSDFRNDPDIKVLLISLKAGGVALNLTVANHIFLMDPWWNPAAEMQAIDRTHRIGQYKPIYATRFIIENSIEERIIKLQEKKKLVFDGTVGYDQSSMTKLTVDDMRFLFQ